MLKGILTIVLLIIANCFMVVAWYGHLKLGIDNWLPSWGLVGIIVISWLIALPEYFAQVPANRIGFQETGGPFSLMQLKVIQEVISLAVFVIFSTFIFKTGALKWQHFCALICLVLAVFFVFKD
ncbi:MAG: DMT family protein [Bacteroidales bacterium]|nr:DMT family protein [Bacteroidales bacterium]